MKMSYNFDLSPSEEEKYNKWLNKLPQISAGHFGAAGGGHWFKFIPTGIGCIIIVGRSDVPELDENITDYDSW